MSYDIWQAFEPFDKIEKGKRSRKGKKRVKQHQHGQPIHTTKNGKGIIAQLGDKNGRPKTN